ncbi:alpha/beta fold hydrolase [Mesorhizobium sp. IMUNJ 23033]|uniref:alpha/beta fold hydrolase n=1 Tax=Mesorhizobium sp. IMUNJ 23033 TaxID=3378039 RepID=UPI00384D5D64
MTGVFTINRRRLFKLATAVALLNSLPPRAEAAPLKLLFVHGRGQGGLNPVDLKTTWLETLKQGAAALGRQVPADIDITFPFYGDALDEFVRQSQLPLPSTIHEKGGATQDEFLAFQALIAEDIRKRAGVTDAQVDQEYGANPKPRGPLNWEWVQAILRAIDRHAPGLSQSSIESFTRDVFLYTTNFAVQDAIDAIVAQQLTEQPTIVVGHSLGSIVAYHVLRAHPQMSVPLYVSVGCPLGITSIRDQFRPLKYPVAVSAWFNAFDKRDVVALYPLDVFNFPVTPQIENYDEVDNQTDNRHGIAGYLNNKSVAARILDAVGT